MASIPMGNSQTLLQDGSSVASQPSTRILNSWKEIASYLGRGVRTIQRYEAQFGLPIHRPAAKERSAVLAFADELEHWLRSTPSRKDTHSNPTNDNSPALIEFQQIHKNDDLHSQLERAKQEMERAQEEYRRTLENYKALERRVNNAKASSPNGKLKRAG